VQLEHGPVRFVGFSGGLLLDPHLILGFLKKKNKSASGHSKHCFQWAVDFLLSYLI
jgi:hypothetical protein